MLKSNLLNQRKMMYKENHRGEMNLRLIFCSVKDPQ